MGINKVCDEMSYNPSYTCINLCKLVRSLLTA